MIEIRQLQHRVGDRVILRGIDLTTAHGETVGLIGPNGAGKSTLVKILALLVKPTDGLFKLDGIDIRKGTMELKKKIGYLPHSTLLYDEFSPLENLLFYSTLYGVKDAKKKAMEWIDEMGLSFYLHDPVKHFSRGMQQRVAIARALIHSPSLLLLDEPHTGLDQQSIALLNETLLKKKKQGVTTVLVSHDFHQAANICDRIILLKNGTIVDHFAMEGHDPQTIKEKYFQQAERA